MFKNYTTIAIRNLFRHKAYSLINILGLAIGLASCILIMLYVQDEWRFDRFHEKADRIYRVVRETRMEGDKAIVKPGSSGPLAPTLLADFPEVEHATRIWKRPIWVHTNGSGSYQWVAMVDKEIFDVFSMPLISGDPQTALQDPNAIVISQKAARIFFGNEDPLGKTLVLDNHYFQSGAFRIAGVMRDLPTQSSVQFDIMTSGIIGNEPKHWWREWFGTYNVRPIQTYIVLKKGTDPQTLQAKLPDFMEQYMGLQIRERNAYHLQPLTRMHLYEYEDYGMQLTDFEDFGMPVSSDVSILYLFTTVSIFILAIACINFMNLSTARSAQRAQEVGIRKVVGAHRGGLIKQFLGESILLAGLAFLFALVLVYIALPTFNDLAHKSLSINDVFTGPAPIAFIGLTLLTGLIAGSYPAFYLSAFRPVSVLKGGVQRTASGVWLRKGLVIFQFAISAILLIGTFTVYEQLAFIRNKQLGFDKELIVTTPIFFLDRGIKTERSDRLAVKSSTVKQAFAQHPNVLKISAFRFKLGEGAEFIRTVAPEGFEYGTWRMPLNEVDEDFFDTFGLEIVAGRNFTGSSYNQEQEFIINETAARQLGWDDPIGKTFGGGGTRGKIVGVVKDFHNRSLKENIGPFAFADRRILFDSLAIKIKSENIPETLAHLETMWKKFLPQRPFEFSFEDERLNQLYAEEMRLSHLIQLFAGLAIFVACLGLFGLASFTAEQRTKEVGVRKVLGASAAQIITLMSREFIALIILANLMAWPIAYFAMNRWLQDFAYRITLHPLTFLIGGSLTFLIAFITVGYQAYKSAQANPIESLRYE